MSKRLLVAEDSKTIQKVIGLCFPGEEYQIISALSADDALSQARQAAPDLVLIDGRMRGKDGYALCREMRSAGLEKAPIVLLHSAFEGVDEAAMRAAGFNAALAKPFDFETLHQVLASATVDAPAPAAAEPVESPLEAAADDEEVAFDLDLEPMATEDAPLTAGSLAEEAEDEMFTLDVEAPVDLTGAEEEPLDLESTTADEVPATEEPEEPAELPEEETAQAWPDLAFDEEELDEDTPVTALELEGEDTEDMLETGEETSLVLESAEDEASLWDEEPSEEELFVDEDTIEAPVALEETASPVAEEMVANEDVLDLTEDDIVELDEEDIIVQDTWEEEPATLSAASVAEELAEEEPLLREEEPDEAAVSVDEAFDRFDDELVATIGAEDAEVDFASPVMVGTSETAPLPGAPAATTAELEQQLRALPEEELRALLEKVARPLLERIAWEVVPDLAESLIREEIRKIKETAA